jgi:hypothetical protein
MKTLQMIALVLGLAAFSVSFAQQPVPPPPKPVNDAPANVEVLSLLRAGMPESVVLNKIHAITDKFDTSTGALVALKQAGATEAELNAVLTQGTAPAGPPPAAAPADTGPSLAETMQYIQEKLNDLGTVTWIEFNQFANNGSTSTDTLSNETSHVVADTNQCRISFYRKGIQNGKIYKDENNSFLLRDVQEIVVRPLEQYENEYLARMGHPEEIVTSTNPPMTALGVRRPHMEDITFRFTDANLADRVAKAMLHAVELCGGGKKDKF